jgi:methionyl-tRNA formyltransferase
MRVVFLGSQEIGARCLEVVHDAGHEIVGVGAFAPGEHEDWADDVTRIVADRSLPTIRGRRFRTANAVDELESLEPEILLAIGWRWILPPEVLAIPPKGCLGIHGSLLPRLRGFAPVNWALIRDEPRTGPTLFYFDEGTDTGDIVGQRPFDLTDEDDAGTVRRRLVEAASGLLSEYLPGLAAGTAPRIVQTGEGASYGPQRRPEDGVIDWAFWRVRPRSALGAGPGVLSPDLGRLVVGAGTGTVEILSASYEADESPDAFERVARDLRMHGKFTLVGEGSPAGPPAG